MDKVIVKTKFDRSLFIKFLKNNVFKSPAIYLFAAAAILSIYFAVKNTIIEKADEMNFIISWSFALIMSISVPFFTFSKFYSAASKSARDRKDSLEIIEFTKAKISRFVEGRDGKIIFGWDRFDSIYEYENHIFLYLDKETGLFFTKDMITEGNIETFRRIAMNNLKPNKKGKIKYFNKMKTKKA